jgi:two-component system, response regulator
MDRERLPILLLVEDSPADVKILQRALTQTAHPVELVVMRDGQEASDYLLRQGPFSAKSCNGWRRPDLIVLDLNLPRLTGLEVLKVIRSTPALSLTPVVILSTSRRPEDVRDAYANGANTYVEKPLEFDRFVTVLKTLQQLWLEMAVLPPAL